jgi:hypothetical protein
LPILRADVAHQQAPGQLTGSQVILEGVYGGSVERYRVNFEWDKAKAARNVKKHGVAFQEAATVFGDPLAITFDDPDHSIGEVRLLTFGATRAGQHVVVCHTELEGTMRIISARLMKKQEMKIYEKG